MRNFTLTELINATEYLVIDSKDYGVYTADRIDDDVDLSAITATLVSAGYKGKGDWDGFHSWEFRAKIDSDSDAVATFYNDRAWHDFCVKIGVEA